MKYYLITMTSMDDSPDYYLLSDDQMESVKDTSWNDPAACLSEMFEAGKEDDMLHFHSPLDATKHIQENEITDVGEFTGIWY